MSALLAIALQAATPAVPPVPERFSILAPQPCGDPVPDAQVTVCADPASGQRLPLPAERGPPDRPVASNPNVDGKGALAAATPVCAAQQAGCQTGVNMFGAGTALVRLIQKVVAPGSCCEEAGEATDAVKLIGDAIGGAKRAVRGKPDKSNRVPIDLSEPAPTQARATP